MSDIWTGAGLWQGWRLTTDHAASSYGQPVLVSPSGRAYGPGDIEPQWYTPAALAEALGVSRAAISDRIKRGTLPPFDEVSESGRGRWRVDTIRHVLDDRR